MSTTTTSAATPTPPRPMNETWTDVTTPAKRGRKPGTPNPNGGRHPTTEPKTRVKLTAEAAGLLAEFAARVNEARGEATRQDEIASAIIVKYLNGAFADPDPKEIAARIDYAQEAGTP